MQRTRTLKLPTNEAKAREYKRLKEIEALQAKARQVRKPVRNSVTARLPEQTGEAARIAATAVGWSRNTAEAAAHVVDAIDAAEQRAHALRTALNDQNVTAAYRLLT